MQSHGPVSYTHLDVYKRQPQGELHYQACDDGEESLIVCIDLEHLSLIHI